MNRALDLAVSICLLVTVGSFFAVQPLIDVAHAAARALYTTETRPAQGKRKTETPLRPETPAPEDLAALTSLRFAAAAMIFVAYSGRDS